MIRAADQRGLTLVELLVAMTITSIVMGVVVFILTTFLNDSRYDTLRDQAQTDSQTMVERLTRELRSAASSSATAPGLLERAQPYDLMFQAVNPTTTYGGSNAVNQYRVRYCLDGSLTLWRQTNTWTTASSTPPTSTACPDPSTSDFLQVGGKTCCVELSDVTNEIGGDTTRPLFTYGPSGYSGISQIQEVQVNLITDLNPGHLPGPSPQLTTGIYLRNQNSPPIVPDFTVTWTANGSTRDVVLNGSQATDPNGQTLQYQWYNGGTCASPTNPLGTNQVYDTGPTFTAGSQTFLLVVTDTQGLTACLSKTVSIT